MAQSSGMVLYSGNWPLSNHRIVEGEGKLVFQNSYSYIAPVGDYKNLVIVNPNSDLDGSEFDFSKLDFSARVEFKTIHHGDTTLMRDLTTKDPFNIFVDLKKSVLYQKVLNNRPNSIGVEDSIILLREDVGIIDWELHDEKKVIGSYQCQKATAQFRGRNYSAWFTPEIPVNFGPWKLNGLPGLILEAFDDTYSVHFVASLIEVEQISGSLEESFMLPNYPIVEKKEYEKIEWERRRETERKAHERGARLQSRAPQGAIITVTTKVTPSGIELEFEFLPNETTN